MRMTCAFAHTWDTSHGFRHICGTCLMHLCVRAPDDALAQMPYADAVLNEVLRMHSVVDGVWRKALEPLTIQGYHVPEVLH